MIKAKKKKKKEICARVYFTKAQRKSYQAMSNNKCKLYSSHIRYSSLRRETRFIRDRKHNPAISYRLNIHIFRLTIFQFGKLPYNYISSAYRKHEIKSHQKIFNNV